MYPLPLLPNSKRKKLSIVIFLESINVVIVRLYTKWQYLLTFAF